jgi:hypothetical protein
MARVEKDGPVLVVTLSERNLLSLLTKLHTDGSACQIENTDVPDDLLFVRIQAEPDDLHYSSPSRNGAPAGPMHPLTERLVAAVREACDGAKL